MFYFHPYLGKIPSLTNIFEMGLTTNQVYRKGQFFPWKTWNFFAMPVPSKLGDDGETTQLCWEKNTSGATGGHSETWNTEVDETDSAAELQKIPGVEICGDIKWDPFLGGIKQAANVW